MQKGIRELKSALASGASAKLAAPMKKYMRNQYDFFGIQAGKRRTLSQKIYAKHPIQTTDDLWNWTRELWKLPQREFQLCGVDLVQTHKKKLEPKDIPQLKKLITQKSWWDTVDMLATHGVGQVVQSFPELIHTMDEWIESSNLWVRRSAILHQLKYKSKTDWKRVKTYILEEKNSEEFFIQKACGWVLREYSKTEPDLVRKFIASHKLAPLTIREGMKWIQRSN